MGGIFSGCSSLSKIPDISKWNTSQVTDMSNMFFECFSLISLSDKISNWNTSKVVNMSYMFYNCSSLTKLPNISKWNISKVKFMKDMFFGCIKISHLIPKRFKNKGNRILNFTTATRNINKITITEA